MSNSFRKHKIRTIRRLSVSSLALLMTLSTGAWAEQRTGASERTVMHAAKPRISTANLERRIHGLINNERKHRGLSLLLWDDTLSRIARRHSSDMASRQYFAHESPEGHNFSYRFAQEGYRCSIPVGGIRYLGAENIFQTYLYNSVSRVDGNVIYNWNSEEKIAQSIVQGWMDSPGHRKNILIPYWINEGIGVAVSPDGKVYITQNFC